MLDRIRRRLAWKLFFSYLLVILVGAGVLLATSRLVLPSAFARHMQGMDGMMGPGGMMGDGPAPVLESFRDAFTDAIAASGLVAIAVAMVASAVIAVRVVSPIRRLTRASQRIAAGNYTERVPQGSDADSESEDEIGQLARQFNEMAARLEQTELRRSELIANVAHELRTPLTTIRGSLEGLMDGVMPAEPETYHRIAREADRLERLVMDLQELSRVEAGAVRLEIAPVDLEELLTGAAEQLRRQFHEKGVKLIVDMPSHRTLVQADRDRVTQVLLNLLGNALQYTAEGGSVTISATAPNSSARVTVSDTGIGIQPDHLPLLFDRFYRVDQSRSRAGGGSGIGLTIAKHLVEAHGGRIWAESAGPGQGSSFHFTLPQAQGYA